MDAHQGSGATDSGVGKALVTGATGLLGRHLVESLVVSGVPTRALVRESSRTDHLESLAVTVQRGSLVDEEDLRRAVQGVMTVYHLGGLVLDNAADMRASLWDEVLRVNVEGTDRLARLAAMAGVKCFVFCSSLRIFGFGNQMLWKEDDQVAPDDVYAQGKVLAEKALLRVGEDTGLEVVTIRPRFIYGNHDRNVLPRFVKTVQKGWVPANAAGICDIVYVRDCVQALRLAAERGTPGQVYNITSGECLSLREILQEVACVLARTVRFLPIPQSPLFAAVAAGESISRVLKRSATLSTAQLRWYLNDHHFSIAKARRELGYEPRYRLADALREIDFTLYLA